MSEPNAYEEKDVHVCAESGKESWGRLLFDEVGVIPKPSIW